MRGLELRRLQLWFSEPPYCRHVILLFKIILLTFYSFVQCFYMHKVRHRVSLFSTVRNTAAGVGVSQEDTRQMLSTYEQC